jgi:type IV secretion system protein TrbL
MGLTSPSSITQELPESVSKRGRHRRPSAKAAAASAGGEEGAEQFVLGAEALLPLPVNDGASGDGSSGGTSSSRGTGAKRGRAGAGAGGASASGGGSSNRKGGGSKAVAGTPAQSR